MLFPLLLKGLLRSVVKYLFLFVFLPIGTFLNSTAFAGDRYLYCEIESQEKIESNIFYQGKTSVVFEKNDGHERFNITVLVHLLEQGVSYEMVRSNLSNGGYNRHKIYTDTPEGVRLSDDITCSVVD